MRDSLGSLGYGGGKGPSLGEQGRQVCRGRGSRRHDTGQTLSHWTKGTPIPVGSAPFLLRREGSGEEEAVGENPLPPSEPLRLEASGFWPRQHFCLRLPYSWQVCLSLRPGPSLQWLLSAPCAPFHLLPSTPSGPICLINIPSPHQCPSPISISFPISVPSLNQYHLPPSVPLPLINSIPSPISAPSRTVSIDLCLFNASCPPPLPVVRHQFPPVLSQLSLWPQRGFQDSDTSPPFLCDGAPPPAHLSAQEPITPLQ